MINNKYFDGIWIDKSLKPSRIKYVTSLPPIENSRLAIFIKVHSNDIDWWMFINEIKLDVWITIIITALVLSIILSIHQVQLEHSNVKLFAILKKYVALLAANFGGGFLGRRNNESHTVTKLIVFLSVYMSSIVFWIAYRASLTSGLTQEIIKLPFTNLEELSTSDYILMTSTQGNSLANRFLKPANQLDKAISQRNIKMNESFIGPKVGLQYVLTRHHRAFLGYENIIARHLESLPEDQQCELKIVWKSHSVLQLSVAFRKGFEFIDQLSHALIEMKEHGILQQIMNRNMKVPIQCPKVQGGTSLGFKKMTSIFVFIAVSFIVSVSILLCECSLKRLK